MKRDRGVQREERGNSGVKGACEGSRDTLEAVEGALCDG